MNATETRPTYYHDLDAARGVLMVLGIVLHAASLYLVGVEWLVSDPRGDVAFNYMNATIHFFRMPAFFVVSGFFCRWSLRRYGAGMLFRRRLLRLGLPLLSTALLVNSVQAYYIASRTGGVGRGDTVVQVVTQWLAHGEWVGHLWFLVLLLAYVSLTCAVGAAPFVGRVIANAFHSVMQRTPGWLFESGAVLFVLPLLSFGAFAAAKLAPGLYLAYGTLSGFAFFEYLPFFLVGVAMAESRWLFDVLLRMRWWLLLVAIIGYALLFRPVSITQGLLETAGREYVRQLVIWSLSVSVLAAFHRFFQLESKFFAWLAQSAYTIYLFHHLVVIVLGSVLFSVELPLGLKFALVVIGTFAVTALWHQLLVQPVAILRLLFNGQWSGRGLVRQ